MQTIDGVVAIPGVERSNALIADSSDDDRFLMGLLRACADAVVVGSGTMLASPRGTWRAEKAYPPAGDAFGELRRRLGKPERPAVAVVTAGGSIDVSHPALAEGAIVLTTGRAAPDLRASLPGAEVVALGDGEQVEPGAAVDALHERGHSLVLSEGGPTLLAALLGAGRVDELFLTVSPLLAGRAPGDVRLSLVEGLPLLPEVRAGAELRSVRRGASHLFLRYGLR